MTGSCMLVAVVLGGGLLACTERRAISSPDTAVLESGRAPIAVTARQRLDADGRLVREILVRAEHGSERWFERSGRDLQLEVGADRLRLTMLAEGLGARWIGGPGVLSWSAPDGSAGLRVELSDLDGEVERPPGFVPVSKTGLIEVTVPVGSAP